MKQQTLPRRRPTRSGPRVLKAHTITTDDDLGFNPEPHMKLSRALFIVILLHVVAVGALFAFQSLKERGARTLREEQAMGQGYPTSMRITAGVGADPTTGRIHYVRSGETLTSIAKQYGLAVDEVMQVNSIRDPGSIQAGQALNIPAPVRPAPLDMEEISEITGGTTVAPVISKAATPAGEIRSRPATSTAEPVEVPVADRALREKFIETRRDDTPSASSSEEDLRRKFLESKGAETNATTTTKPASSSRSYVVEKGDNPVAIAKRFNVSYADLLRVNNISDPRKLRVGQKLIIP